MFKQNKNIARNALVAAIALSVNSYAQEGMDEDYIAVLTQNRRQKLR